MDTNEIESRIYAIYPESDISLEGEDCSFSLTIVCDEFHGMSSLQRQQKIYSAVDDLLKNGRLHALSIKAYTLSEWEVKHSATKGLVTIEL